MRKERIFFALAALLPAACAGGSARYGCPAETGRACASVSQVYAEEAAEGVPDPFAETGRQRAKARRTGGKGPGRSTRKGAEGPGGPPRPGAAEAEEAAPVYVPPRAVRIRIAPWQDSGGALHGEKYVYVVSGGGRWTLRGKTVPPGESEPGGEEEELAGTEERDRWP